MPNIDIKITNLAEIRRAFGRSPQIMSRELNTAIAKSVFKVSAMSRINTPVATGRLRASTYTSFGNLKGEVGTNTNYDIFVHEGTRFMRARPYLKQAVDETSKSIDDYFQEAVQKTLDIIGREV